VEIARGLRTSGAPLDGYDARKGALNVRLNTTARRGVEAAADAARSTSNTRSPRSGIDLSVPMRRMIDDSRMMIFDLPGEQ
jgi:hypothetical protein